jgi:dienelactone hydrolase
VSGRRLARLGVFGLGAAVLLYLGANLALAGVFMLLLTHPGCPQPIPLDPEFPAPQIVRLHTPDNLDLPAWYYPPRNGAAVIAFGSMQGALGESLPPVGFLLRKGYGVLQLGSRAYAHPPAAVTLGAEEVLDGQAAVEFLAHRPEVQRIGAFGFSMGAAGAIRTAASQPRILAVAAEGGYPNLGESLARPGVQPAVTYFELNLVWIYRLLCGCDPWQISPIDDLPRLAPRAVLLIFGEKEAENNQAHEQYRAAGEPRALWIVPGGDHGTNYAQDPQAYAAQVSAFFDRYLLDGR